MARPLARGVLSFGLVAIPWRSSATKDEHISFHYHHAKCGSRVRNRLFCPVCNIALERQDVVRGYDVNDFNCFKAVVPKESIAAAALARVEDQYTDNFPLSGGVVIVCNGPEALDLLACAQNNFPDSFSRIREALRKANFYRQPTGVMHSVTSRILNYKSKVNY